MKRLARLWRRRDRRQIADAVARRDTHVTPQQAPLQTGISPQMPASMPRYEDDAATRDRSRSFHDQPGSGKDTATRHFYF
jgi:hypothetical protein